MCYSGNILSKNTIFPLLGIVALFFVFIFFRLPTTDNSQISEKFATTTTPTTSYSTTTLTPTLNPSHSNRVMDVRYSTQDAYAPWPELFASDLKLNNRVWTVSGHALLSNRGDTEEQFLSYSETKIKDKLERYLSNNTSLDRTTTDLIILDMESPIHPKRLGEYSGDKQKQIIEAFKMRIKIAREMFPNAKLSLYGVIVSDARGDSTRPFFKPMMQGYERASQLGMFDDLDYISPVLYHRFGLQDKEYPTLEIYTREAIEQSQTLKKSGGTHLDLATLHSFKVYNGNSKNSEECVAHESINKQLAIIPEYPSVKIVVLWAGPDVITDCAPQEFLKTLR